MTNLNFYNTMKTKEKERTLAEMKVCLIYNKDKRLTKKDKRSNASDYVLARDNAMILGIDVSGYPRSIGMTNFNFPVKGILARVI